MEENQLSKKEKRELAKTQKFEERGRQEQFSKIKKLAVWVVAIVLVAGLLYVVVGKSAKPKPGIAVEDQGREHIPETQEFAYNSNPPTSGSHYAEWTRAGVYDKPVRDGHLVHGLEHGYVIISYNCAYQNTGLRFVKEVFAHEEGTDVPATGSGELDSQEDMPDSVWKSDECKQLIEKLTGIYEKKGKKKLIVIARPQLDAKIALTAWDRIDKFNDFDEGRIVDFINAFRDHGPEQTTE